MHLFTIRSRRNPRSKGAAKYGDVGGAYVNCYIQFKDYGAAEKLARLLIRESGWIPAKRTVASVVRKGDVKTKKETQYYSEALKCGYTLVFRLWPKDAEDANVDYEAEV